MKFSEHWLREWVNPALDTQALCHLLTMAGLEVEDTEPAAPPLRAVRTIVIAEDSAQLQREYAAEVRPRTESRLSFRVPGKMTRRLVELGEAEGWPVRYVKLHGALANMAAEEPAVAALSFAAVEGLAAGGMRKRPA